MTRCTTRPYFVQPSYEEQGSCPRLTIIHGQIAIIPTCSAYSNDPILQQHVDLERYLHLTQLITARVFAAYYGVFYRYDSANRYLRIEVPFDTSEATRVVMSKRELKVTARLLAGLRYESYANLNKRSRSCDRHRVNSARGAIFLATPAPYLTTSRSRFKSRHAWSQRSKTNRTRAIPC